MKAEKFPASLWTGLSNLGQQFSQSMSRWAELKIWQKSDRQGNISWHGYDPNRGEYVAFGTEAEIRMWIEQRYYR